MKDVLAIQQEQKYKRHRPETTLLYQLVERYYPEFTTNPAGSNEDEYGQLANTSGFSLHAGVFANADEPDKLVALIPPPRLLRLQIKQLCLMISTSKETLALARNIKETS